MHNGKCRGDVLGRVAGLEVAGDLVRNAVPGGRRRTTRGVTVQAWARM